MKARLLQVTCAGLVFVGALGFLSPHYLASAEPTLLKGRIPPEAFTPNGIDVSRVPEYVVAYARNGEEAGFVRRRDLFPGRGKHKPGTIQVFDDALQRVVGEMVPGRGFVPAGKDIADIPPIPVTRNQD